MTGVRIGLVGAGSMGANHARVIAAAAGRARLACVVDPDESRGAALAERHGTRWLPALPDAGLDAVVVAAPTDQHKDLATAAIAAGLPLLVEKPVSASLADTDEVVRHSERAGVPLICGLLERFNPAFVAAMSMLEEPLSVRAERHSPYVPRIRTGVAWDLLVHDVDLVVRLFGGAEPESVVGDVGYFHPASATGAEDVVETMLRFPAHGIATVSASRIGQRKIRTLVVHELDRVIEVDLLRRGVTAYRHTLLDDIDGGPGFRQQTVIEVPEISGPEPLAAQLLRFLDLVTGRGDPDAERRSILPVHRVVDRVMRAARDPGTGRGASGHV